MSMFTVFPRLPKDLQLMIWEAVEIEARDFSIEQKSITHQHRNGNLCTTKTFLACLPSIPALLHTCADSRMCFLKLYEIIVLPHTKDHLIFFHIEKDILHLTCHINWLDSLLSYQSVGLGFIRNLAIHEPKRQGYLPLGIPQLLEPFLALRTLSIPAVYPWGTSSLTEDGLDKRWIKEVSNAIRLYWTNTINPRQRLSQVYVTCPPKLVFRLDVEELPSPSTRRAAYVTRLLTTSNICNSFPQNEVIQGSAE